MKYFFILGNNPTLSLAELLAVFGWPEKNLKFYSSEVLTVETEQKIDCQQAMKDLGGTIKIGEIHSQVENINTQSLVRAIKPLMTPGTGKFKFGFSYYGKKKLNLKTVGMETKKFLKEREISCRWVVSRESVLSSVVVGQNKLTEGGVEIVLIDTGRGMLIGKTLSVQPFKELSARDYGRPSRDDRSGMLPPKLAMMMINLAMGNRLRSPKTRPISRDEAILDPFCGSGTVLQEAVLKGFKNLIGSDVSEKAVCDTKENLEWLANRYKAESQKRPAGTPGHLLDIKYEIINASATELSKEIKNNVVGMIVTEPYLGPQRGKIDIQAVVNELNDLYSKALGEFRKILKKDGSIVMVWPVFNVNHKKYYLKPSLHGFGAVMAIPESFLRYDFIRLSKNRSIVYGRPGQRVWREIVVLRNPASA